MLKLLRVRSGWYRAFTVALMLGAAAGILVLLTAQTSPPPPPVSSTALEGISLRDLAADGITLSTLDPEVRPKVSREAAEQVALDGFPSVSIRQSIFAHVVAYNIDRPAWIVSLNPNNLGLPGPRAEIEYLVVIVDAETGEFIFANARSKMPPGGWPAGSGGPAPPEAIVPPEALSPPASPR